MGVIHKLKKEIVLFVINQKKNNPQISCRALAEVTAATFNLKVAKSSINNILKKANLSSKVGRRSDPEAKKFKIPSQKKKQLFSNVQKHTFMKDSSGILKETKRANSLEQRLPPLPEEIKLKEAGKPKEIVKESSKPLKLSDDKERSNAFLLKKKTGAQRDDLQEKKGKEGVSLKKEACFTLSAKEIAGAATRKKGLGLILLRLLLREISNESVVGSLFREYQPEDYDFIPSAFFDVGVLQYIIGEDMNDVILNNPEHAIWSLFGLPCEKRKFLDLFERMKTFLVPSEREGESFFQIDQCFIDVYAFEFVLSEGKRFYLDASLNTVSTDGVFNSKSLAWHKAITLLSKKIIANNERLILKQVCSENQTVDLLRLFLESFKEESLSEIKKIKLIRKDREALTSFSIIPRTKRTFVLGLYPGSQEFFMLLQEDKAMLRESHALMVIKNNFCQDILGKDIFYRETGKTFIKDRAGKSFDIKAYFVYAEEREKPSMAIITNDLMLTAEETVLEYLRKYPGIKKNINFKNNINNINKKNQTINQRTFSLDGEKVRTEEKKQLLDYFGLKFKTYLKERIFNPSMDEIEISCFIKALYEMDGCIMEKEKYVTIVLFSKENFQFFEMLNNVVKMTHNGGFSDEKGRHIYIKLAVL